MKQKMVIKVSMHCKKCHSEAMTIVAGVPGVESVEIAGDDKDQVVVIGDGVDSVELTRQLRKKMKYAELVSLCEANEEESEPKKKPEDDDDNDDQPQPTWGYPPPYYYVMPSY